MGNVERATVPDIISEPLPPKNWDYQNEFRPACINWVDQKYPRLRNALQFEVSGGIYHLYENLQKGDVVADNEDELYKLLEEKIVDPLRGSSKSYGIL